MIVCKSPSELEKMRRSGKVLRQVLDHVSAIVAPGISTMDLERAAEKKIQELGAKSAFKGYQNYPCVLCTSVNNEVVHGIPSEDRVLKTGDEISIDCGVVLDGYYTDSATTVAVGEIRPELQKLLDVTRESLRQAIEMARIGNTVGHIGATVQNLVESSGFSVVRDLVGHGIGKRLHEEPQVPNYGRKGHGQTLLEGMVLAIEPMVNIGKSATRTLPNHWTVVTEDGSCSAHFEHSVAVTKNGPLVLTA
jgi:methionyl aminopeptidase